MEYRRLKHTDLRVSQICLGTGQYGSAIDESVARRQLDEFSELGGNYIDTAHVYGNWIEGLRSPSEKIIGRWFRDTGRRESMVLTTKGGHPDLEHMGTSRLSRQEILLDIEESLRFLQTDHIDMFLLHRDDPGIPVEQIIDCLDECVVQGKIRYYGCSNWHLSRIQEAAAYARKKGSKGFTVNQLMWSLADINHYGIPDSTFVPMDKATFTYQKQAGLNAMAYMSQAKAFFTRKAAGSTIPSLISKIYENRTNSMIYERARETVETGAYSFIDLSLLYLMGIDAMPVIPVAAFRTMSQFREGMQVIGKQRPDTLLKELEEIKAYVYGE